MSSTQIDIVAFGAHPDDVELHCSGALLMLKRSGYSIGIVDLSNGELSTRGTPAIRKRETAEASRILQLDARIALGIPDGEIADTKENRLPVIRAIRRLRPRTVLMPYHRDRHPDHEAASMLVKHAAYQSGLARIEASYSGRKLAPWRPTKMFYYPMMDDVVPALLVDISSVFEQKLAAIRAYETQFGSRPGDGPQTFISSPGFLDALTARWRKQGFAIGRDYAEGLIPIDAFEAPPGSLVS